MRSNARRPSFSSRCLEIGTSVRLSYLVLTLMLMVVLPCVVTSASSFEGTWEGPDRLDGSLTKLVITEDGNRLTGAFSDAFSTGTDGTVVSPGYSGSGSGILLSRSTAQMTFSLALADGTACTMDTELVLSEARLELWVTRWKGDILTPPVLWANLARRPVGQLRVVTFNARWLFDGLNEVVDNAPQTPAEADAHLQAVADYLRPLDANLIALQEVENELMLRRLADRIGGNWNRVFIEGDCFTRQNVCMLSRYPILDSGRTDEVVAFPVPGSDLDCDGGTLHVGKNCWANIDVGGKAVTVIAAHMSAYMTCEQAIRREAEAIALRNLARQVGFEDGREVILLGDLNDFDSAVPDCDGNVSVSQAVAIIKDVVPSVPGDELHSVTALIPSADRYTCWVDRNHNGVDDHGHERSQIDFILVSQRLLDRISAVEIAHTFSNGAVSDHWAILAVIEL